jgi:hypothetical protein
VTSLEINFIKKTVSLSRNWKFKGKNYFWYERHCSRIITCTCTIQGFFLSKLKPGNWSDSVVLKPYLSKEG